MKKTFQENLADIFDLAADGTRLVLFVNSVEAGGKSLEYIALNYPEKVRTLQGDGLGRPDRFKINGTVDVYMTVKETPSAWDYLASSINYRIWTPNNGGSRWKRYE